MVETNSAAGKSATESGHVKVYDFGNETHEIFNGLTVLKFSAAKNALRPSNKVEVIIQ